MLKNEKITLANELRKEFNGKNCVIILSHKQITFSQIDSAKRQSKEGTVIKKIPNKIAKKALEETEYKTLSDELKNEVIFVMGDDAFDTCKTANSLKKDVEKAFILKGASKNDGEYSEQLIDQIGKIGSKEVLQSKLLNVINGIASKMVRLIKAKTEK